MEWKTAYVNGQCVGVGIVDSTGGAFSEMICETVLPDNDQEYEQRKDIIEGRMKLMAASLEMKSALELIAGGLSEMGPRQIADQILKRLQ